MSAVTIVAVTPLLLTALLIASCMSDSVLFSLSISIAKASVPTRMVRLPVPTAVVAQEEIFLPEGLDLLRPELVGVTFAVHEDNREAGSFHAIGQAHAVDVDEPEVFGITRWAAELSRFGSFLASRYD